MNVNRIRTRLAVVLTAAPLLVFTSCATAPEVAPKSASSTTSVDNSAGSTLDALGLAGMDARQVIERLEMMPKTERPQDFMASVRPDRLIITDADQRETSLPMPDEQFYVSFAPYLNQTHDCHFHSLTTCTGELQNADVQVKITDDSTGEVLVDEALRTYDNGFLGVWLPRDVDATLTVEHDGRSASVPITTEGDDAATCITTLQLG